MDGGEFLDFVSIVTPTTEVLLPTLQTTTPPPLLGQISCAASPRPMIQNPVKDIRALHIHLAMLHP